MSATLTPKDAELEVTEEDREKAARRNARKEIKTCVASIARLAKQLDRTVMKYPKSGRAFFVGSRAQSRYIRVQQHPSEDKEKSSRDPGHDLYLWRQGRLGWWESEDAYLKKEKPKGSVLISKIHNVMQGADKMAVEIEHKEEGGKGTLELVFPAAADAKLWCEVFLQLLTRLHEDLADVQITRSRAPAETGKYHAT